MKENQSTGDILSQEVGELLKEKPLALIILQRHGGPIIPISDESVEANTAGFLSEDGMQGVKSHTELILEQLGSNSNDLDFLVCASPTALESRTGVKYGKRAIHTARVIQDTIRNSFTKFTNWKLLNDTFPNADLSNIKLIEPNIHYIVGSSDPRAYITALQEYFGDKRWERYHSSASEDENLEKIRKEIGAEGSPDIAERTIDFFKVLKRYALKHTIKNPDRPLIIWLVSHNDSLRSLLQWGLKAGIQAEGYSPDYNENLVLSLNYDSITTNYKGTEYSVEI